jgi:hypothetical protein
MKAELLPSSRTIRFTGINSLDGTTEIDVVISYKGDSNVGIGITIDNVIIPKILERINSEDAITCKFCGGECDIKTAHIHQGRWVGDDCCWDESLRTTE